MDRNVNQRTVRFDMHKSSLAELRQDQSIEIESLGPPTVYRLNSNDLDFAIRWLLNPGLGEETVVMIHGYYHHFRSALERRRFAIELDTFVTYPEEITKTMSKVSETLPKTTFRLTAEEDDDVAWW